MGHAAVLPFTVSQIVAAILYMRFISRGKRHFVVKVCSFLGFFVLVLGCALLRIYLFRSITQVAHPLDDNVFFATSIAGPVMGIGVIFFTALKMRELKSTQQHAGQAASGS
jgi:formate-dependent nitrite reductase membrane component NrfD